MLFELSIARKYLLPRKRQISLSLISIMSVGVISLVVWLVLVFLSVIAGIEKAWEKKLTAFSAPIKITPTTAYYSSYYYQIDENSQASSYSPKNIGEKRQSLVTDPFNPLEDSALPAYFPQNVFNHDGSPKDLVKLAFDSIEKTNPNLVAQDYEVAGALLKLRLIRPIGPLFSNEQEKNQGHLTQASYFTSFAEGNPHLGSLIETPRIEDLNHLFFQCTHLVNNIRSEKIESMAKPSANEFQYRISRLLSNITVEKVQTTTHKFNALFDLLPENKVFRVMATKKNGSIHSFSFSQSMQFPKEKRAQTVFGTLVKRGDHLLFTEKDGQEVSFDRKTPLFLDTPLSMVVTGCRTESDSIQSLQDIYFEVNTTLQDIPVTGTIQWEGLQIEEATIKRTFEKRPEFPPFWPYFIKNSHISSASILPEIGPHLTSLVLPKSMQGNGVKIGDIGYVSYGTITPTSNQEQRIQTIVTGFYDPGVMSIGPRAILAPDDAIHTINSGSGSALFDQNTTNGIQLWFSDLGNTEKVRKNLLNAFEQAGILPYWTITPYYEYEFAKDLLMQFQSDRYLFTLIGIIVLTVACCNIISLLVILVNDKKREIAILRALGASKKSIALIFTFCGGIVGLFSTLMGVAFAIFTLHYIDHVVSFLSFLQGHEAFNVQFFGKSLPNELSRQALLFILVATPVISLLAGLIPALKACKIHPSNVLRSEG